jgi:hypothetical protein
MPTRIQPVRPGEGQDAEVEGILEFSKGGFQDTEMFGLIARRPELLKVIAPVFGELFGGNGKIEPYIHEMMRLKAGETNSCAY